MKQTLLVFLFVIGISWAASAQVSIRPGSQEVDRSELRVYPNPVVDNFEITATGDVELVRVYNLVGREVKQYDYEAEQLYYVGDLPRGMYLVQLIGADNKAIITRRLNKK